MFPLGRECPDRGAPFGGQPFGLVFHKAQIGGREAQPVATQSQRDKDWPDRERRLMKYAELWAKQEAEKGRRCGPIEGALRAAWRFMRGYFLKTGFMEGRAGLLIALSCAREVREKYRALRRIQ